jgi:hypothetical protein
MRVANSGKQRQKTSNPRADGYISVRTAFGKHDIETKQGIK